MPADPEDDALDAVEDPEAPAPELFEEAEVEDVNGFENDVEGGGVGKERDVLVDARAQNCSATLSAAARSPPGHDVEMQSTRPEVKSVALCGIQRSTRARSSVHRTGGGVAEG